MELHWGYRVWQWGFSEILQEGWRTKPGELSGGSEVPGAEAEMLNKGKPARGRAAAPSGHFNGILFS